MAKTQVATIWQSDRIVREVRPADGKKFSLRELQDAVGGTIEHVPHTRPFAYCNEEGRLIGLPVNALASLEFQQILVGDVIQVHTEVKQEKLNPNLHNEIRQIGKLVVQRMKDRVTRG